MNPFKQTALHKAIIGGKFFVHAFWAINFVKIKLKFLLVVSAGYKDVIELLMGKGANANAVDYSIKTPLHYIVSLDNFFRDHDDDRLSNFHFNLNS